MIPDLLAGCIAAATLCLCALCYELGRASR